MRSLFTCLAVLISAVLLACGGAGLDEADRDSGESSVQMSIGSQGAPGRADFARPAATAAPAAMAAPRAPSEEGSLASASALQTVQRKVISSASVSLEVEDVQESTVQVRVIAESLGGFVEQLSSFGGTERQRANMTIRVLQDQFFSALERIEALGEVQSRNVGSEDVSEQFIDLEARLKSAIREEESLLKLLERAGVVSEILAIERELARVRSEIERFQGQLNFLERRVDLATINVSLSPPDVDEGEPPSASLTIVVSDVGGTVESVKALTASLNGEIDRVFLSMRDGKEQAGLSLRVFTGQFQQAVDSLEGQGEVKSKELVEGTAPPGGSTAPSEKPQAGIDLSLIEKEDSVNVGLIAAIAGPLGGIALAVLLGLLFFTVYRAGSRMG